MQVKYRVIVVFSVLVLVLSAAFWYNSRHINTESKRSIDSGNFNIQATLPNGWNRNLKETKSEENMTTDIIIFSNDKARIEVKVSTIKVNNKLPFTGYSPVSREQVSFSENTDFKYFPDKSEGIRLIRFMDKKLPTVYYIVDGNRFNRDNGHDTFTYELPLLVKENGKETKTSIVYYLNTNLSEQETKQVLEEADSLMLSLKAAK
jgi:hypothetical protein